MNLLEKQLYLKKTRSRFNVQAAIPQVILLFSLTSQAMYSILVAYFQYLTFFMNFLTIYHYY